MLGEVALYCFVILVLTGVYLTFFFTPGTKEVVYNGSYAPLEGVEMSQAYESVLRISFDVRAGLVMRQIHHWAALLFVAAIIAHLMRIFFTGAFRRPREINWMIGVTLLHARHRQRLHRLLAPRRPTVGHRPPHRVLGGAVGAGRRRVDRVPDLRWRVPRQRGTHAVLRDPHPHRPGRHRRPAGRAPRRSSCARSTPSSRDGAATKTNVVGARLWPTFMAKTLGLFFLDVRGAARRSGGLAQINPVWIWGPFEPAAVSAGSQPDWYVGWLEGSLRLVPAWETRAVRLRDPEPVLLGRR